MPQHALAYDPALIAARPSLTSEPSVELVEWMGGDLAVVRNGRQTTGKSPLTKMPAWGPKFLDEMMRKRHGTPFEAAVFTYRIECSIAVAREWFRHRIGSFNEASLRVSEAKPVFHLPSAEQARKDAGRYEYEPLTGEALVDGIALFSETYDTVWTVYKTLLDMGWSRELARLVLPMALHTRFSWTVNARALMNFLSLRTAPDALREIREPAELVGKLWTEAMPLTAQAFIAHGCIAP